MTDKKILTPVKAIRAKCMDCNGTANEVRLCPCKDCALYPYRLGKNPNRKGTPLSEERKTIAAETFKRARELKFEAVLDGEER